MISAIPMPTPVMLSGVRLSAQKPGFARDAEWWPSGGVPVQSSSSHELSWFRKVPIRVRNWFVIDWEASRQMAQPNARDTKLIQYLNEAYGKERELETALEAHIAMTTRPPYKKRLREHLKETKGHARQLKTRIRELGGKAEAGPVSSGPTPVVEAASTLTSVASKAVAAAQGPLHAIRGTGEAEKMLKNAKSEYHNEFEEIATYTGIEALAERRQRQGDGQARPRHPPRGGADGEVPREADPAAREGGGQGGDPGRRAA